jgi:tetratricopeptide (TPR) repeat protein
MKRSICCSLSIFVVLICFADVHAQSTIDAEIIRLNAELSQAYATQKYDKALVAAKKLVDLSKQKYGKTDVAVARALKIRGRVENTMGDWYEGSKSFGEAADIFKKQTDLSKADGASFAEVLEALADLHREGFPYDAERELNLALKWREKSNGAESFEAARTIGDLANVKFWNHDYIGAAELNRRSLLLLSKIPAEWTRELRVATYYRTQCSYRKAKIEDQFESVKKDYENQTAATSAEKIVKGGVMNGKAISLRIPAYPTEANRIGASGTVTVEVLISEKGEILSACATSDSNRYLTESSERAAYRSKYSPTLINGLPVKVMGIITYNFVR